MNATILRWLILSAMSIWAIAALYLDFRRASLSVLIYALCVLVAMYSLQRGWDKALAIAGCLLIVLTWWLSLKPSNNRPWQPDVSQTAWAEVEGDHVTIHNVRDCSYRAEFDYTCHFGDKQHIAFSIERRKVIGQAYSAIRGFFRQYELIETVADERDVVRLRTNYRTGEDVCIHLPD